MRLIESSALEMLPAPLMQQYYLQSGHKNKWLHYVDMSLTHGC